MAAEKRAKSPKVSAVLKATAAGVRKLTNRRQAPKKPPHAHPPQAIPQRPAAHARRQQLMKARLFAAGMVEGHHMQQMNLSEESPWNMALKEPDGFNAADLPPMAISSALDKLTIGEIVVELRRQFAATKSQKNKDNTLAGNHGSGNLQGTRINEDGPGYHEQRFVGPSRDSLSFPIFNLLPTIGHLHPYYFEGKEGNPKRNWCLLAEITEVTSGLYLRLKLKDKAGIEFTAASAIDAEQLPRYIFKVGHTIALLHGAKKYLPKVGLQVVEITKAQNLNVISLPLREIINLSERWQSTFRNGRRSCYSCGCQPGTEAPLVFCERCGLFPFCNNDCAKIARREQWHWFDCQILQDKNMRMILAKDWKFSPGKPWCVGGQSFIVS